MVYRSILCSMLMIGASGLLSMEPSGQPVSEITSGNAVRTTESMRKIIAEYVNPYPRRMAKGRTVIALPHIPIDLKPGSLADYHIVFFDQFNRQAQTIPFKLAPDSNYGRAVGLGIINLSRGTSRVTPIKCGVYSRFGKGKHLSLFIGIGPNMYAFDHRNGRVWLLSSSLPNNQPTFDTDHAQILDEHEHEIAFGILLNKNDPTTRLCLRLQKDEEGTVIVHDNTSITSMPSLAALPWERLEQKAIRVIKEDAQEDEKMNLVPSRSELSFRSLPHLDYKLVKYGSDVCLINKYGRTKKLPSQNPWESDLKFGPLAEDDRDVRYCSYYDMLYDIANDTSICPPLNDAPLLGPTFAADSYAVYILPNVEELSDEEVACAYHLILEGLEPLQQYIIAVIKKKHPLAEKIKIDLRTFEPIANS